MYLVKLRIWGTRPRPSLAQPGVAGKIRELKTSASVRGGYSPRSWNLRAVRFGGGSAKPMPPARTKQGGFSVNHSLSIVAELAIIAGYGTLLTHCVRRRKWAVVTGYALVMAGTLLGLLRSLLP